MELYMTAKEVAALVRLSEQTIRRYTMLKQIPYHKIIRAVRYKRDEIELWVEEREAAKTKSNDTSVEADLFIGGETGQSAEVAEVGTAVEAGSEA